MKNYDRCSRLLFFAAVFAFTITTSANAALYSRLNGQAVYDSDLNITWTANANINGRMTWADANTWAANLVIDGIGGWRLPTTTQPDPTCDAFGYSCTGSEMGHLFYTELGGAAHDSILNTNNGSLSLFNNFQISYYYWSGTEDLQNTVNAWDFYFGTGGQDADSKDNGDFALAVHPGDVAAVPIPAALWLFGSGLVWFFWFLRRRAK